MKKVLILIGIMTIIFVMPVFSAPLDILEVLDGNVIVEASDYYSYKVGDRFIVLDYNYDQVAVIQIDRIEYKSGILQNNYICKIISGSKEVKPGYQLKKYDTIVRGSFFFEYSKILLDQKSNLQYESLSGYLSRNKKEGMILSMGLFVIGLEKNYPVGVELSTSYIDLGEIKTWSVLDIGGFFRKPLLEEHFFIGLSAKLGMGPAFGTLRWARPDSTYDDDIGRNSGEAKIQLLKARMMFNYRFMATTTINLHQSFGLQFRAGYIGYLRDAIVDTEIPDKNSGTQERWTIKDEWLETDIKRGAFTLGVSVLFNLMGGTMD